MNNIKVGVISLGCDKNRVESEYMISLLSKEFDVVDDISACDAVIINTCAFIESAVKESIDTIMEAASYGVKIIVTGCFNMRYKNIGEEIEFPEVSAFVDNQHYTNICEVVYNVCEGGKVRLKNKGISDPLSGERVLTTPMHYANLRIADGCDNCCTYCAIPKIRGGYKAVAPEKLVNETKYLSDNYGTREFILVAQDVSRYRYGDVDLLDLIDMLEEAGAKKLRLMYCYPEAVTKDLLTRIAEDEKILPYIDLPLQHIDDGILSAMNRKSNEESVRKLLNELKEKNITVRSTFISGFPGETITQHEKLLSFIKEGLIDYAGFFPYFREEGTKAYSMKGQIPQREKKRRVKELLAAETTVIKEAQSKLIGKTLSVTFDYIDYDKELFVGHTDRTHPETDPKVYFKSSFPIETGGVYDVVVKRVVGLDLKGETK